MSSHTTYHQPHQGYNNSYYQSSPYSLPNLQRQPSYQSSPSRNMPTYYIDSRRSSSRSGHSPNPPVLYQTSSGHQYPASRDYAYADGGRRRRSSSVGHGGHYSSSYYPPPARSSHSRSPREHSSSHHRRSSSHSRQPQYLDAPHHSHHRSSSRRPSVSYSDSGHHHSSNSRPRRHSESLGDRFRRWFGGGFGDHHTSRGFEYVDAHTGRPVDKAGRPIYRV